MNLYIHNKDQVVVPNHRGIFGSFRRIIALPENEGNIFKRYQIGKTMWKTIDRTGQRCGSPGANIVKCIQDHIEEKVQIIF